MERTIQELQDTLRRALLDADVATLEVIVAPDCRIIGPRGFVATKKEWIDVHASSDYTQVALDSTDVASEIYGRTAICWEIQSSVCEYKGERIEGRFRVTKVWVNVDGHWQLAAAQYTSSPLATSEPPPVEPV